MGNTISYIFYILCFFCSIFWSYKYDKFALKRMGAKEKVIFGCLIVIPPILVQGLRYDVGTDYLSYLDLYNGFNRGNRLYISYYLNEPLFIYVCKVLYQLTTGNESALFIFNAIVTNVLVFLTFDYYKRDYSLPILYLFYYAMCFPYFLNIERQGVAVAIVWYSTRYVNEKKIVKFICCILIAVLIHNTAIVGISLYLMGIISDLKGKYIKRIVICITAFLPIIFGSSISFLSTYVPIFRKYTKFIDSASNEVVNTNFIFCAFIAFILWMLRNYIDKNERFMISFLCMMNLVSYLLNNYIAWGFRISFYFELGIMLGFAQIIKRLKLKSNRRIISAFVLLMMCFYFTYKFYIQGNCEIFPYKFVWMK